MTVGDGYLQRADAFLVDLFAGWNNTTTVLATIILIYIAYPWLTWRDPDTHPLLLARQSTSSPVRRKGESAIHRSLESPHGYPLKSGLNVKEPGAPRWSAGRTGDLRDVWRRAVQGHLNDDGTLSGKKGKFLTVLGVEQVVEQDYESISKEINVIGQHVQSAKGSVVAICLSNSQELLASIFGELIDIFLEAILTSIAAAFYGFKAVLIPYKLTTEDFIAHLRTANADFLIAEAGTIELPPVTKSCPNLKHVVWVAKVGSQHMDWNEVPEGVGGQLEVSVWHELCEEKKSTTGTELPEVDKDSTHSPLGIFHGESFHPKLVEYPPEVGQKSFVYRDSRTDNSQNLVSGIAAQISALPRGQRLSPTDVVLSADALSSIYPLTVIFAALFSGSTIALNSVAGANVDFRNSATGISPTIIIAPATALSKYHEQAIGKQKGFVSKLNHSIQSQSLDVGILPKPTTLSSFATGGVAAVEPAFTKLRLIYASHEAGSNIPLLSSQTLADLRVILGTRIICALSAPGVAGAIVQNNVFDYRRSKGDIHFGGPLSSVELKAVGHEEQMSTDEPQGKVRVVHEQICSEPIDLWKYLLTRSLDLSLRSCSCWRRCSPGCQSQDQC